MYEHSLACILTLRALPGPLDFQYLPVHRLA